jgi:transcription antitermination factor NusG
MTTSLPTKTTRYAIRREATRAWRVFYAKPRAEKAAAARLREGGVDILLPLKSTVRQWSDRKQRVEEPLFRGYLFAQVDEKQRLHVLEDKGIVRSVSFGGHLASLTDREAQNLLQLANSPESVDEVVRARAFPEGSEVYVERGPLAGVQGYVTAHKHPFHLYVLVESIHQAVRINIPADWVRRV